VRFALALLELLPTCRGVLHGLACRRYVVSATKVRRNVRDSDDLVGADESDKPQRPHDRPDHREPRKRRQTLVISAKTIRPIRLAR
jgi:UPF0716 family protein affecting phage T7 exclusion